MNKYKEIKKILNNQEVVQRYLGLPEKHNSTGIWYKRPFRNEKTSSFCVSSKGIHDFGSSEHYDIISFVQRYFNTTSSKAYQIICYDFNIHLENEYVNSNILKNIRKRRDEENKAKEKIKKWYNDTLVKVCDEIIANRRCMEILKDTTYYNALSILYDEEMKLNYKYEQLINTSDENKIKLYLEEQNDR